MQKNIRMNLFPYLVILLILGGCDDNSGDDSASEPISDVSDIEESGCVTADDCEGDLVCDPYLNEGKGECVFCVAGESICDGTGVKTCLADGTAYSEVTPCIPDDPCLVAEGCVDGECMEPEPKSCSDDNPCTDDFCQPFTGECIVLPNLNGDCCTQDTDCDDGLTCTTDVCGAGGVCSNLGGPCADQIAQWGEKGDGDGELKFPAAIAVLSTGEVVISDKQNNRLSVFSRDGVFSRHFDTPLPEQDGCLTQDENGGCMLSAPSGLDVFTDGRLIVADTGNDRLIIYNADGSLNTVLKAEGKMEGPTDVAIDAFEDDPEGSVWVVNNALDNVVQISISDDVVRRTVGETGDSPGKFRKAFAIETDGNGNIYVTDKELNRVQLIDPVLEEPIAIVGETGSGTSQFEQIGGVVTNWKGQLFVADPDNKRVQSFFVCTPSCVEGLECGSNGCGGQCGACLGTATCESNVCVGEFPGGEGCKPGGDQPGCAGCECETCVCEGDPYCCETAWDEVCIGFCANECGGACPDPAFVPELDVTLVYSAETSGAFLLPLELFIDRENVLWVIDSVASKVTSFQLSP